MEANICLPIDALDEYKGNYEVIARFFEEVLQDHYISRPESLAGP